MKQQRWFAKTASSIALLMAAMAIGCYDQGVDMESSAGRAEVASVSRDEGIDLKNQQGGIGTMEKATFGAGCFWGVEAAFRQIEGVSSTAVGYAGGTTEDPTYRDVCGGKTGHAEVVQVEYDPAQVPYEKLLEVFWDNHNPTTPNRQGPDVGAQYRSSIFFHTPQQRAAAQASKERLDDEGRFNDPIVTEITPASAFHLAEEYHQQYLEKRGLGSCRI